MITNILLIITGMILLIKGADFFVDSASSIAKKFKVSTLVIGLTIVAFGTSFPELTINIISALNNNSQLALGNIIGSNIANILLILGVSSIITDLSVKSNTVWKEIPMSFLGAILLLIFALQPILDLRLFSNIASIDLNFTSYITFTNSIYLLIMFIIFMYYTYGIAKNTEDDEEQDLKVFSNKKSTLMLIFGIVSIYFGGKFTVEGASDIALSMGLSQSLIGLTIVALGTSLPELVTSVVAATKKQTDIAIGNVVGSNIFNIFLVLGSTGLVSNLELNYNNLIDIIFLLLVTFGMFISLFIWEKHKVGKKEGTLMLITYFAYIIYAIIRG